MRRRITIQRIIATGGFTLPVAIVLSALLWIANGGGWSELLTGFIHLVTGYLLIELNTSYSLIRTRTSFHVTLYTLFVGVSLFLHPYQTVWFTIPLFLLALHQLFQSLESADKIVSLYHSFLLLGCTILLDPHFLLLLPLFWIGMFILHSASAKGFFATLLGLATPYWLLLGYSFLNEEFSYLTSLWHSISALAPFDYGTTPSLPQLLLMGSILLLTLICSFYYLNHTYLDKSRTRTYFYFLLLAQLTLYGSIAIFPQQTALFFALSLPISALIGGHFFTLTHNRFSNLFFITIFVMIITATTYYVWMH
ncbi:MAG: hypothetical protein ACRCUJ_10150 [Phocaeicola sp.]